jgi:HK97 gp10 family phage protein
VTQIRLDSAAIARWAGSSDAKRILENLGEQIAQDAKAAAPRDTGAGAESIQHEVGEDADGAYVRVSWDRDHFYMFFHEVGTSRKSARPFLRPAATKRRNL